MVLAANRIMDIGGGNVVVDNNKVMKEMALPIAGLMSDKPVEEVAKMCEDTRNYVHQMGVPDNIAPFMSMAFVSLPVIPSIVSSKGNICTLCPIIDILCKLGWRLKIT